MPDPDVKLPEAFVARLCEIFPEETCRTIVDSYERPSVTAFRINTLLAQTQPVLDELTVLGLHVHAVPWYAEAFWVEHDQREKLLASRPYQLHHIYVQGLSSMVPPLVLDPRPGERVLDLTAAPGSKTLQIAYLMGGLGEIAAVEYVRSRFFRLRDNLSAQGAGFVRTFLKNGEHVWRNRPEYFDRVLLDAPCSSEGRFDLNDPESLAYWSPKKIKEMAGKQRRLLFSAVQSLRPGGVLVYSTCTFAPEENEVLIDSMLQKFGDALRVVPTGLDLPNLCEPLTEWKRKTLRPDLRHARRILPDGIMEGFFVCKIEKIRSTLDAGKV